MTYSLYIYLVFYDLLEIGSSSFRIPKVDRSVSQKEFNDYLKRVKVRMAMQDDMERQEKTVVH